MPYLLRVRVPDRPGMLGEVASAIGRINGDIESIAVVERDGEGAVDDFVVELPTGMLAETLYTAVASVDGVVVETVQRHAGRSRVRDELELLDAAATSADPLEVLVDGLPGLMASNWALGLRASGVAAASLGAPDTPPLAGPDGPALVPLAEARVVGIGELWADADVAGADCALIAAPAGPEATVLLARNGGAEFRPVELLRLAHLANVVAIALR